MKTNTEPLLPDTFYHVYNRGINGEQLFKEERNYAYFLQQYSKHISPIADTYAYCLLGNHFHLLIRTKSDVEILQLRKDGIPLRDAVLKNREDRDASWYISNQFANFFKSYSQAINKAYKRTGGLFEEPFRRMSIKSDHHLSQLVYYIHSNPEKHGFCSDFRDYPHSSYWSHLSNANTRLQREELLKWFGDSQSYAHFHKDVQHLDLILEWTLEF